MAAENSLLDRLQAWFKSQCNQEWEHSFGIQIGTLDNPGWHVQIDLTDTPLSDIPFHEVRRGEIEVSSQDWIHCRVSSRSFEGTGDASKLNEILSIFLDWVESEEKSSVK